MSSIHPDASPSIASTIPSAPATHVPNHAWQQHVLRCETARQTREARTRHAKAQYEWKPGIIEHIPTARVDAPTPNPFEHLTERGITPKAAPQTEPDRRLAQIRDTRRQTQRTHQQANAKVVAATPTQRPLPRARRDEWGDRAPGFHEKQEGTKQRAATAHRLRTRNIQQIAYQQKFGAPDTHFSRRARGRVHLSTWRQPPAPTNICRQGRYPSTRQCRDRQRVRPCCSGDPLCHGQASDQPCYHAAPTDTSATARTTSSFNPTAPPNATCAPLLHQPTVNLLPPPSPLSAPTAPTTAAPAHDTRSSCSLPPRHRDPPTRIQPGKPAAASGPSMCADSGCSTIIVTKRTATAAELPNTGPSKVTIQTASGHIKSAMHDTTVPLGLGPNNKASVLADSNLVDSLCGVAPLADAGLISIFHPGDKGFASYRRQDVDSAFTAPPP